LYCGWTVDLDKRVAAHNAGTASRYTRRRLPVELAWSQEHPDRSSAMKAEAAVKKLPRPDKLALAGGEVVAPGATRCLKRLLLFTPLVLVLAACGGTARPQPKLPLLSHATTVDDVPLRLEVTDLSRLG